MASKNTSIALGKPFTDFARRKVESGEFGSTSEVVREALRLLEEEDRIKAERRDELIRKIKMGTDQIRDGQGIEIRSVDESREYAESVIRRGRERLKKQNRKSS